MPPRNPSRDLVNEESLARRVAHERERRGWTYEGLAKRLSDAGCPIQPSAIYKIEKGEPRRRITVDEHVALAQVFGVPMEDLLLDPAVAGKLELVEAVKTFRQHRSAWLSATADVVESFRRVRDLVMNRSDIPAPLKKHIKAIGDDFTKLHFQPEEDGNGKRDTKT